MNKIEQNAGKIALTINRKGSAGWSQSLLKSHPSLSLFCADDRVLPLSGLEIHKANVSASTPSLIAVSIGGKPFLSLINLK